MSNFAIEKLLWQACSNPVEAEGGNGCFEIKNWIRAMGVMSGAKAQVIAYEAMHSWITGMGFAEPMKAA